MSNLNEELSNLTILELQQECKKRGLKKNGIKVKLIQRLSEYIQKYGRDHIVPPEKTVPVEKTVPAIHNPHPYMEEYEEQLIESVTREANVDDGSKKNITSDANSTEVNEVKKFGYKETPNSDVASPEEHQPTRSPEKDPHDLVDEEQQPTRSPEEDPRDTVEELTELIHTSPTLHVSSNDGIERSPDEDNKNEDVCDKEVDVEQNEDLNEVDKDLGTNANDDNIAMVDNYIQSDEIKSDTNEAICADMDIEVEQTDEIKPDVNGALDTEMDIGVEVDALNGADVGEENIQELDRDQSENCVETEVLNEENADHEVNEVNNRAIVTEEMVEKEEEDEADNKHSEKENVEIMVDESNIQDEIHDESEDIEDGEITINIENTNEFEEHQSDDHFDLSTQDDKIIEDNQAEDIGSTTKLPKKNVVPVSLKRISLTELTEGSEEKVARRKRRWGSTCTSMKESGIPISSESIKKLIPDMKIDAAALLSVPEFDYHQDDDAIGNHSEEVKDESLDPADHADETSSPPKINKLDRVVKIDPSKEIPSDKFNSQDIETVKSESGDIVDIHSTPEPPEPHPTTESVDNYEVDDVTTQHDISTSEHQDITTSLLHSPEHAVQNDQGDVATTTHSTPAPYPTIHCTQNYEVDDEVEIKDEREKSPSPARNPVSQYIHIKNLVRPYTIRQLKSVIRRTGLICEGGFWINNIKSQCYVKLSTKMEAAATRDTLHGLRWPVGSPKFLKIDFAINEQMYRETTGLLGEKPKVVIEIDDNETDRRRDGRKRIPSKDIEKEEKKEIKSVESPVKLLDDLFRKTKSTPCIYWLPLTDQQVLEREKKEQESIKEDNRDTVTVEKSNDRSSDRRS